MPDQPTYRVLGPLEILAAGRYHTVDADKWRTLLALLLLADNAIVSADTLVDELWPDRRPRTGAKPLQVYVGRLRRLLSDPDHRRLVTRQNGYRLAVEPGETDLHRFHALAADGRRALSAGDAATSLARLRAADELWRGAALADVYPTPLVDAFVRRVTEERQELTELRVATQLATGGHAALVAELAALCEAYPLREELCRLRMVALYRCGRQVEALEAYQSIRTLLRDEYGVEPGPALRDLEHAILVNDVSLDAHPARISVGGVPHQLPRGARDFVGRHDEIDAVLAAVEAGATLCVFDGLGGIGKTALAVHIARQLRESRPGGCLFVDLRGADGTEAVEPVVVLGRFLRALGAPAAPADLDEAAAAFRSLAADRRLLVVLDNAASEAQIRPLLPAGSGCVALVTSRHALAAIDADVRHTVDRLPDADAHRLFEAARGRPVTPAESADAAEIVRRCAGLPLALRVVAARLAQQPGTPLHRVARSLADEHRLLDELQVGDLGVRATFELGYRALRDSRDAADRTAARAFRLFGLVSWADADLAACTALLGEPASTTAAALRRLVDAHLLEVDQDDRYHIHDLLRVYAGEKVRADEPDTDRHAAGDRLARWYLATAWRAAILLYPTDLRERVALMASVVVPGDGEGVALADPAEAGSWLTAEYRNLMAVARHQLDLGRTHGVVATMCVTVSRFMTVWYGDLVECARLLGWSADQSGDRATAALAMNMLSTASLRAGRIDQAIEQLTEDVARWRALDVPAEEASCLNILGLAYRRRGDFTAAIAHFDHSLAIRRALGQRHKEAAILDNLGITHQDANNFEAAVVCHLAAAQIAEEIGDRHLLGLIHLNTARALVDHGQFAAALDKADEALAVCGTFGHQVGMGLAHLVIGESLSGLHRLDEARTHLTQAIELLDDDDPRAVAWARRALDKLLPTPTGAPAG